MSKDAQEVLLFGGPYSGKRWSLKTDLRMPNGFVFEVSMPMSLPSDVSPGDAYRVVTTPISSATFIYKVMTIMDGRDTLMIGMPKSWTLIDVLKEMGANEARRANEESQIDDRSDLYERDPYFREVEDSASAFECLSDCGPLTFAPSGVYEAEVEIIKYDRPVEREPDHEIEPDTWARIEKTFRGRS